MPVLYLGRNVNHISRVQFLSGFAPLLIITPTRRTKKDLTAVMVMCQLFRQLGSKVTLETDTPISLRGHR